MYPLWRREVQILGFLKKHNIKYTRRTNKQLYYEMSSIYYEVYIPGQRVKLIRISDHPISKKSFWDPDFEINEPKDYRQFKKYGKCSLKKFRESKIKELGV